MDIFNNNWLIGIGGTLISALIIYVITVQYNKWQEIKIAKKISLVFNENKQSKINLKTIKDLILPSGLEEQSIKDQITYMENLLINDPESYINRVQFTSNRMMGNLSSMRLPELKNFLNHARSRYEGEDAYYLNETTAHKIQLSIFNDGSKYLTDASIQIKFPKTQGLNIISKIHSHPNKPLPVLSKPIYSPDAKKYPNVYVEGEYVVVNSELRDVRHKITTQAFDYDLRLWISPELIGEVIYIKGLLFAKELPEPLHYDLQIIVI